MDYALDLKRFLCIFRFMIKRTVEEQILRTISFLESGRVFSSTDFADIANQNTIRTALRRLTLAKKIDALGHSLYYKRICTKEFPYGYRPKNQSIANAIARRFSWKIFPTLADTFAYFGLDKSGDFVFPSTGPNKKFEFDLFEYPRPVEFRHIPLKLSRIHRQVRYDAEKRGNGEYYFPYRTVSGETGKQGVYIYRRYILPFHRFTTGAKGAVGSSS